MEILDVRQNSGAIVLSKANAAKYIKQFDNHLDLRTLKKQMKALVAERDKLNVRIMELTERITDMSERFFTSDPLRSFEFEIPANSPILGKTIADSMFWQNTGATIVALRRNGKIIPSPGPYAVFMPNDVIIVSGDFEVSDRVNQVLEPEAPQ